MAKFNESQAECLVFTFKEGLLSKIAHDLKIVVSRFHVEVGPGSVSAEFDLRSLRVVNAMKDGEDNPSALSDADKTKIADQIGKEVLESEQHGRAVFTSRSVTQRPDGGYLVSGDLALHGTTKTITAETKLEGGRQVATIPLHQPDFGITPFKAMMGTLKVKADVVVRLSVPNA